MVLNQREEKDQKGEGDKRMNKYAGNAKRGWYWQSGRLHTLLIGTGEKRIENIYREKVVCWSDARTMDTDTQLPIQITITLTTRGDQLCTVLTRGPMK